MHDGPVVRDGRESMPIAMRVRDACQPRGIGRSKLYELIASREIKIVKVGAITLIPVASLTPFLHRLSDG
jgi:excisionase family DNA binding protein